MQYQAERWGVSFQVAVKYLQLLSENRCFAIALTCPVLRADPQRGGQSTACMVIASSTAATTSLQQDNMRMHAANEGIADPYRLHPEAWLYEGLAFLNYAGIGNPDYKGTKLDVSFGDFMRAYCIEHGVEFARPHVFGGAILGLLASCFGV